MSGTERDVAPVVRIGPATGSYRRRIRLERRGPDLVWGGLEDDFHHFEVRLTHDGTHVRRVDMDALRWPWTTCPDAGRNLHALEGMALSERCTAVAEVTDPKWNCTHQFDLAGLCVAHAARGIERRQYDVELPPADDGVQHPRLWRDGALVHEWTLRGDGGVRVLVAPEELTAAPWKGGFIRWADRHFDPETAEGLIVLRRACDIGMGRGMDLEAIPVASDLAGIMSGICYSMQPDVMTVAFRTHGTIRDFDAHPDALLSGTDSQGPPPPGP